MDEGDWVGGKILCTCATRKGGHVKGVCLAEGCRCRGFKRV